MFSRQFKPEGCFKAVWAVRKRLHPYSLLVSPVAGEEEGAAVLQGTEGGFRSK